MDFLQGVPIAMLGLLFAPILARRWTTLAVIALVGAAVPSAVVVVHGGLEGLSLSGGSDPSAQILVAFCALFLCFFVLTIFARLIGIRLETLGWPRWRLLPLDLFALSPAAGFYGTLYLSALSA